MPPWTSVASWPWSQRRRRRSRSATRRPDDNNDMIRGAPTYSFKEAYLAQAWPLTLPGIKGLLLIASLMLTGFYHGKSIKITFLGENIRDRTWGFFSRDTIHLNMCKSECAWYFTDTLNEERSWMRRTLEQSSSRSWPCFSFNLILSIHPNLIG